MHEMNSIWIKKYTCYYIAKLKTVYGEDAALLLEHSALSFS